MDSRRVDRRALIVGGAGFVGTLTLGTLLSGCGGGSTQVVTPGPGNGTAIFRIAWPERTRLIPAASSSIRLTVTAPPQNPGQPPLVSERLVIRPAGDGAVTSSEVFASLPSGNVTVTAAAYPSADGTGVAQAAASLVVTIRRNEETLTDLSLASTIDRVQIAPAAPLLSLGGTTELVASALDASGAIVITSAKSWTWTSENESVATDSASGDRASLTGVSIGSVTVRVVENESGKSAGVTAGVIGPIVAPSAFASVEGSEAQNGPFQAQATTYQVQYAEALLGGLPIGAAITGLQFRLEGAGPFANPAVDLAYSGYIIRLARAAKTVGSLSLFFAENMLDPVTVYDAPLSLAASDFPTGASGTVPNAFGPLLRFTTPYIYRGGDLVLYLSHGPSSIVIPGAINNGVSVDAVRANPAQGHNTIAFSQFNADRTGATGTNTVITRFIADVPAR